MNRLSYLVILLLSCPFIAVVLSACDEDEDCSETDRQMMWCGVYTFLNDTSDKVINDTIPYLTVTAWDTDSIIINKQQGILQLDLPLRYSVDSTVFVFHYLVEEDEELIEDARDTLVVKHKNTPYFISMDCGYQMKQEIEDVYFRGQLLDSIDIRRKEANNNGTENIKLFYRP